MKEENTTFITIKDGSIDFGGYYFYNEVKGGGFICQMPSFDIFFYAKDKAEAKKRAHAMVRSFFQHWLNDQNWKQFILQLHKLGFRTDNHNYTIKQLLNRRQDNTKFHSNKGSELEGVANEISAEIAA